jgi:hypothetical protein
VIQRVKNVNYLQIRAQRSVLEANTTAFTFGYAPNLTKSVPGGTFRRDIRTRPEIATRYRRIQDNITRQFSLAWLSKGTEDPTAQPWPLQLCGGPGADSVNRTARANADSK